MHPATPSDKELIIAILAEAFADNKSVNSLLPQGSQKTKRLRAFMGYAVDVCTAYGEVHLSADCNACALVLLPDKKRLTWESFRYDLQFVFGAIGLGNVRKALRREARIKARHPQGPLYYLWFIGVMPDQQGKGIGSALLKGLVDEAAKQRRTICLETSTLNNLPWYKKAGFVVYDELEIDYQLYFLKRERRRNG